MARENGAHVEYDPSGNSGMAEIVRVWGSKLRALESAVDAGNKYAFVQYGEMLVEALARVAATSAPRAKVAARPVRDEPQA